MVIANVLALQNDMKSDNATMTQLEPFGLLVTAAPVGSHPRTISAADLNQWVDKHRIVILRDFALLAPTELPEFGQQFGELLEWEFGAVNELRVQTDARNYLYTNRAVPFHWDGAFIGRVPRYIVFVCDIAPRVGGETLFCDTIRVLNNAPADLIDAWRRIEITYTTEKLTHYGGTFTSSLITRHPGTGQELMRFAEPVTDLNPVELEIRGIPVAHQQDFLSDMHRRLNDDAVCYRHAWHAGDLLIADNRVLLHGRHEFPEAGERHLRRVNVV